MSLVKGRSAGWIRRRTADRTSLAALGGGFGGWLGWRAAPPLPRDAAAAALARLLVPRGTPLVIERHDMVFGYEHPGSAARVVGSSTYTGGYVKLLVTDAGDASTLLSDVRDQMGLAGWRINGNLVGAGTAGIKGRLAAVYRGVPVLLCDARRRESGKEAMIALMEHVMSARRSRQVPSPAM